MSRIVVGVSGDRTEDAGLLWALREGAVRGRPVVAVHAWPGVQYVVDLGGAAPVPWSETEEQARDRLDAVVKAARERSGSDDVDLQLVVMAGRPADVLESVTCDDDVLVLTREHVSLVSRLIHGSVSTLLLKRGLCAAVVVPAPWRPTALAGRVLVGVDRSSGSLRALVWAAEEAQRRGVPLVPVLVRSMLDAGLVQESVDADREELRRRTSQLGELPDVRPEVRAGDPGRVLVEMAAADDLVVVGRTGTGAASVADHLLGSNSLHVVRHATCPVVVTPG